jgi:stalled ribosome rescue protein Dom34
MRDKQRASCREFFTKIRAFTIRIKPKEDRAILAGNKRLKKILFKFLKAFVRQKRALVVEEYQAFTHERDVRGHSI